MPPVQHRAGLAGRRDLLGRARIHKGDVGRVACLSAVGEPVTRYFLGAASFGLTGSIARAMGRARIARLFGHGFAIRLHRLAVRLTWRATRVRLMAEGYDEIAGIASVSLAPAGGKFDAAVLDGLNRARSLRPHGTAAPTLDTRAPVDVETDGSADTAGHV